MVISKWFSCLPWHWIFNNTNQKIVVEENVKKINKVEKLVYTCVFTLKLKMCSSTVWFNYCLYYSWENTCHQLKSLWSTWNWVNKVPAGFPWYLLSWIPQYNLLYTKFTKHQKELIKRNQSGGGYNFPIITDLIEHRKD